jgi:hypothetical protein
MLRCILRILDELRKVNPDVVYGVRTARLTRMYESPPTPDTFNAMRPAQRAAPRRLRRRPSSLRLRRTGAAGFGTGMEAVGDGGGAGGCVGQCATR